jgi:hypothetical protein
MVQSRRFTPEQLRDRYGVDDMKPALLPAPEASVRVAPDRPPLRTGDHAAILYWDAMELLETIVPYLVAGLEAGDKVVYVADDLKIEDVSTALRRAGVDVDSATAMGRLMLVTARDAFFGDGTFDVERALAGVRALAEQAAADGYKRVRFSVEMTYLLANVAGIERGVEFESRANDEVFAKYPFVCICSFNAACTTNEQIIADVLATHPILISAGSPLLNPHYRPWSRLSGT